MKLQRHTTSHGTMCDAAEVADLENAVNDCLFALHEIYCKCRIDDVDFEEMSEVEQMQYAREKSVAEIARDVINKITDRGLL